MRASTGPRAGDATGINQKWDRRRHGSSRREDRCSYAWDEVGENQPEKTGLIVDTLDRLFQVAARLAS